MNNVESPATATTSIRRCVRLSRFWRRGGGPPRLRVRRLCVSGLLQRGPRGRLAVPASKIDTHVLHARAHSYDISMGRSQPARHPAVLRLRLALQTQGPAHHGTALWTEARPINVNHVVLATLLAVVVESVFRWRASLFGWECSVACSSGNCCEHCNHCGTAAGAEARRGARLRVSAAACA
jgi:hypothetical protein